MGGVTVFDMGLSLPWHEPVFPPPPPPPPPRVGAGGHVCVYYCSTYYKAASVRHMCVCLLLQSRYLLQSCSREGRGIVEDMSRCYERRRAEASGLLPVPRWTSLSITHCVTKCVCFITAGPITKLFAWGGRRVEDMWEG